MCLQGWLHVSYGSTGVSGKEGEGQDEKSSASFDKQFKEEKKEQRETKHWASRRFTKINRQHWTNHGNTAILVVPNIEKLQQWTFKKKNAKKGVT